MPSQTRHQPPIMLAPEYAIPIATCPSRISCVNSTLSAENVVNEPIRPVLILMCMCLGIRDWLKAHRENQPRAKHPIRLTVNVPVGNNVDVDHCCTQLPSANRNHVPITPAMPTHTYDMSFPHFTLLFSGDGQVINKSHTYSPVKVMSSTGTVRTIPTLK